MDRVEHACVSSTRHANAAVPHCEILRFPNDFEFACSSHESLLSTSCLQNTTCCPQRCMVPKSWDSSNFFHIQWIELRLCIQQATTSVASGKILPTKTNWSKTMKNLCFSVEILHIVCGSLATQHARWHKSITLRGGQAVPTSYFVDGIFFVILRGNNRLRHKNMCVFY